jgi:Ca2+-binding RTX toxin-like protein
MYFDQTPHVFHNSGDPWSVQRTGDLYRFEVRSGDHWRDETIKERSEISSQGKLAFDKTYTMSYDFQIEPGARNTAEWLNMGQFHGTPDAGDVKGLGPVFAIKLAGERMRIVTRSDADPTTDGRVPDNFIYTDNQDIVRGHWYHMTVQLRFDPDGGGIAKVWRDGDLIADYKGPLAYNDAVGPYWKMGIYRENAAETLAINYRDFNIVEGATSTPTAPAPEPTPEPTPDTDVDPAPVPTSDAPLVLRAGDLGETLVGAGGNDRLVGGRGADTLHAAAGNDQLTGGAGNDVLNAGAGADVLAGGYGNDLLLGGLGADLLKGNGDNDTLVGGSGADTLIGGSGNDVFRFEGFDGSVDSISDFSTRDKIELDLSDFGIAGADVQFMNGLGAAASSQPTLHYTASDGALYLDVNGGSASDAVRIAVLTNHAALSEHSFLFV